jgi:polar amino acid transport system ATP-binding protein
LLGSSGVGKSTLLRVLNNLEPMDSGSIELDGIQLDTAQIHKQHHVGMLFQHFNLFEHLTVEENITLVLRNVLGKSAQEAHLIAGELLRHYGLDDKAKLSVHRLSGGQKQRLALVRTLAIKPRIICLDEPTSALDPMLTTYVAHMIQNTAQQGYHVLIATHDTLLVEKLTCTIYLMEHGSIIESAHSKTFFSAQSSYPRIAAFVQGKYNALKMG